MTNDEAIQIFLPGGDPSGLKIISIPASWNGRAFLFSRGDVGQIKNRKEAQHPALYFLLGEEDGENFVYTGQTDNFQRRLTQQSDSERQWDTALVFTGENDIDVQYLERLCIEKIREANRYNIKNAAGAPGRNISDFQKATNNNFFKRVAFLTTVLGYPLFEHAPSSSETEEMYYLITQDTDAKGTLLSSGEFIVYAGSLARIQEADRFGEHPYSSLRKKIVEEGVLTKENEHYIFTEDYVFKKPSAAAAIVRGRAANGWTEWKDKSGKTLDENKRQ